MNYFLLSRIFFCFVLFCVNETEKNTLCCEFCLINLFLLHIKSFTACFIRATIKAKKMPFSTHNAYILNFTARSETEIKIKNNQSEEKQENETHRNKNDRMKRHDSDKQQISKPFNKRNAKMISILGYFYEK